MYLLFTSSENNKDVSSLSLGTQKSFQFAAASASLGVPGIRIGALQSLPVVTRLNRTQSRSYIQIS